MNGINKINSKIQKKGFTLVELLVTAAIFSMIFSAVSGLFASALKAQRRSLASQELLAQTSYAMEYMSRQLRMASGQDPTSCTGSGNSYLLEGEQSITFLNYQGCCIQFRAIPGVDRLDQRVIGSCSTLTDASLTSANFKVEKFNINLAGGPGSGKQARVTLFLRIKGKSQKIEERPVIEIQNTISQRNLNI
jgi:prepilin-type N-terminal cleavage/methylation domain-containing protein